MALKDWYTKRTNHVVIRKGQPALKFPTLGLPEPKSAKILSTPTQWDAFYARHKTDWPQTEHGDAAGMAFPKKGTSYIHGDVDPKRIDAINAHEGMHQLFGSVREQYGEKARGHLVNHLLNHTGKLARNYISRALKDIGYDEKSPSFNEEILNYFHTYLTDPVNRDRIRSQIKSDWHKKLVDKHIKSGWRNMIQAASNVSHADFLFPVKKSVDDKEWNTIKENHVPGYSNVVDSQPHTLNSNLPKTYSKLLQNPEQVKAVESGFKGASPKLIHDVSHLAEKGDPASHMSSKFIMTKPYHQKLDPEGLHFINKPISGWSTMATKALYNAGNIGHLAEDVSSTEHKGIPVTVHSFAPSDMETVADSLNKDLRSALPGANPAFRYKPNPLHIQQIALMDFLTNNADRHANNLLVGGQPSVNGHHNLLALDHESNFQYNKSIKALRFTKSDNADLSDAPHEYLDRSSALKNASMASPLSEHASLANWWKQHGPSMRQEMEKQLASIKSDKFRDHIRKNFEQRWNVVNDWSKDGTPNNWQQTSILDKNFGRRVSLIPYDKVNPKHVNDLLSKLPQDPYEAANVVSKEAVGRPNQKTLLNEVTSTLLNKMNPEQFANFLINNYKHPTLNVKPMAHDFIFGGDRVKEDHLRTFLDKLDKMPDNFKEAFPFWEEHFKSTPMMRAV